MILLSYPSLLKSPAFFVLPITHFQYWQSESDRRQVWLTSSMAYPFAYLIFFLQIYFVYFQFFSKRMDLKLIENRVSERAVNFD